MYVVFVGAVVFIVWTGKLNRKHNDLTLSAYLSICIVFAYNLSVRNTDTHDHDQSLLYLYG